MTADEAPLNIRETAYCMQALYRKTGKLKPKVRNRQEQLEDNSLIFIQMIYIFPEFQRRGLLRHALSGYHELLGRLSEWYAFAGRIVLVPAKPSGNRGLAFGDLDDAGR